MGVIMEFFLLEEVGASRAHKKQRKGGCDGVFFCGKRWARSAHRIDEDKGSYKWNFLWRKNECEARM